MEDTILSADQTEQATELNEEKLQVVHGGINAVKSTIVGIGIFGAIGTTIGIVGANNKKRCNKRWSYWWSSRSGRWCTDWKYIPKQNKRTPSRRVHT